MKEKGVVEDSGGKSHVSIKTAALNKNVYTDEEFEALSHKTQLHSPISWREAEVKAQTIGDNTERRESIGGKTEIFHRC